MAEFIDTSDLIRFSQLDPNFSSLKPSVSEMERYLQAPHQFYRWWYLYDMSIVTLLLRDQIYLSLRIKHIILTESSISMEKKIELIRLMLKWKVAMREDLDYMLEIPYDVHVTPKRTDAFPLFQQIIQEIAQKTYISYSSHASNLLSQVMRTPYWSLPLLEAIKSTSRWQDEKERELAFLVACACGKVEYVDALINSDPPLDVSCSFNTGLRLATRGRHLEIIKRIFNAPFTVHNVSPLHQLEYPYFGHHQTALRIAINFKSLEMIELFWSFKKKWLLHEYDTKFIYNEVKYTFDRINKKKKSKKGKNQSMAIIRFLLENTDKNISFDTGILKVILKAAQVKDFDLIKYFLEDPRLDKDFCLDRVLLAACQSGSFECVQYILQDGRANPAYKKNAAILIAEKKQFTDCVTLLANFDYKKLLKERQTRTCRKRKLSCNPDVLKPSKKKK
jgi:hypothetical protein